jgi:hypothetical protein
MFQFLADQIDQLDLALDQLSTRDRNFDRFAIMLIDNVVELTLYQYAIDQANENESWGRHSKPRHDPKAIAAALGQNFEHKIRLARSTAMVTGDTADSIQYLHTFRNTVYHKGQRHEGILHSLGVFYFQNACAVLKNLKPRYWSYGGSDHVSHRAIKYLGKATSSNYRETWQKACDRLSEVSQSLGGALFTDLLEDMVRTINQVDKDLTFLTTNSPSPTTRAQEIIAAQAWPFAFTDEGKAWANSNGCPPLSVTELANWLSDHYPWPIKNDPIPSWNKRKHSLEFEGSSHTALKKYCDFMKQTEDIRGKIDEATALLDGYIQHQIDVARGK